MSAYAMRVASLTRPTVLFPARNLCRPDGAAKECRYVVGKAAARGFWLPAATLARGTITFTLLGGTFLTLRARLTFRMRVTLGPILTRRTVLCRTRSLRRTRLPITLGTRTIAFAWRTLGTTALARRPLAPRLDGGLVTHAGDRLHRAGLTPRTIPPALALRPLCTLRRTALGCNTF